MQSATWPCATRSQAMTDSSGAIKPIVPQYEPAADYSAPPAAVLNGNGAAPLKIRSIDEAPAPTVSRGTSDMLVTAAAKIFQAITTQIAYHEREAQKLRDSLKPFASIGQRQNVTPDGYASVDAIRAVLDMADKLNLTGEPQT